MAKGRKRQDDAAPTSTSQTGSATLEPNDTIPTRSGAVRGNGTDRRDRIAQRAYELYLARGGGHGSDWEDWLAAEREVLGANEGERNE